MNDVIGAALWEMNLGPRNKLGSHCRNSRVRELSSVSQWEQVMNRHVESHIPRAANWLDAGDRGEVRRSDSTALLLPDKDNGGDGGKSRVGRDLGGDDFGFNHYFPPCPLTQRK